MYILIYYKKSTNPGSRYSAQYEDSDFEMWSCETVDEVASHISQYMCRNEFGEHFFGIAENWKDIVGLCESAHHDAAYPGMSGMHIALDDYKEESKRRNKLYQTARDMASEKLAKLKEKEDAEKAKKEATEKIIRDANQRRRDEADYERLREKLGK